MLWGGVGVLFEVIEGRGLRLDLWVFCFLVSWSFLSFFFVVGRRVLDFSMGVRFVVMVWVMGRG